MASELLSIEADWKTVFLLVMVWYLILKRWEAKGQLDKWNATRVFGAILMVRTSKGKAALELISKPRRFWRIYGEISLWVCWIAMFLVGLLLLFAFISAIFIESTAPPPSASELVAIPGLNPMIPLGWGAFAFIICLVIHEFGHAIQARAHGMRVRNFGLLMLGPLPLGAFAEPEHAEIISSPRRERQRMFAAGPATNIFAAIILMLLMSSLAGHFSATQEGVHSSGIIVGTGAEQSGLEPYDIIYEIDGEPISDIGDFNAAMDGFKAGDIASMQVLRVDGTRELLAVNITDKRDYFIDQGVDEEMLDTYGIEQGDAFLGIERPSSSTSGVDSISGLANPLIILITPFELQGIAIHPSEEAMLIAGDSWFAQTVGLSGLLFLVNMMFWLIWVNILLGFTNLIPMVPFDGGHLFRDIVHGTMSGLRKVGKKTGFWRIHPLTVEHFARKASSFSSLLLLVTLIFIMVMPYL